MSIVKGTQQRMFAVPAGQAASRGQLSGRSGWKGAEGRRKKKGPTIKKRKRVLFQALSYKHLEEGGGGLCRLLKRGEVGGFPSLSPDPPHKRAA